MGNLKGKSKDMVEAAPAQQETRDQIRARIKAEYHGKFDTMDQYEIKIDEDGGNVQVRQHFDEATNVGQNFGEVKLVSDLVPDDFRAYFERWDTAGKESNADVESIHNCGSDQGVDTIKIVGKAPWPLSNRVMFSTRYMEFDVDGGHQMLFCGDGNQSYYDANMTE